jgi:putative secretion ATPase (PEP-CTERM system associated)
VYEKFYNFSGPPFLLTPDTRFFFGSSGHSRAISHLVFGLAQEEGFIVITGEVGAGKTTLVEQLWSQLDHNTYIIARIVTTQVSGDDLLRLVMANFGLGETPGTDKATLLRRFEHMVRDQRRMGRRCLLVVDEVQNLSVSALEELRMLSNITVDGKASVQTILLGQPQFRPLLASQDLEQLRQRVLASYHLGPLSVDETRGYVEHRLRTVGWTSDPAWQDDAFLAVHRHTGGIPRRINTLCSRVLLFGALEETHRISGALVDTIAGELEQDLGAGLPRPAARAVAMPASLPVSETSGTSLDLDVVLHRVEALERAVARQDRVFRRILDLLGQSEATRS